MKHAVAPPQFLWPVSSSVGDAGRGIAAGAVRIEQTYTTSDRHHNQMEPHVTTALWHSDGTLTLCETTQHIFGAKELVSSEIVARERLLGRAREIAQRIASLPPLTASYTRVALTQKLRRIVDESVGYGLALEGISAADVARSRNDSGDLC